ncbi:thiol-disulfide oxidoreductase [Novipirellula galeiformis]|uniref:Thiol-disulfide oxidoreductase n=1 Tax=Novipirellula galeiformis TaxID=2528004 RepID=A0A5C6CAR6_9BACT|nr:redoxin domain-containing protein [Novipirellula galeiformis]TWU21182.1 thiol-disulfide oxidoreductase [Novipirellula galeiformis]
MTGNDQLKQLDPSKQLDAGRGQTGNKILALLAAAVMISQWMIGFPTPTHATSPRLQNRVAPFSLPGSDGSAVAFSTDPSVKFHVLCFLGTECPLARIYGPRLVAMSDAFSPRGVQFIGINSNIQDSMQELQAYANDYGITFPIAKDYDRRVAVQAGATRTPEVFVIDRAGLVRYCGRIDDQYEPGIARSSATQHDLRDAIEALLSDQPVPTPQTTAMGCLIALPRTVADDPESHSKITYCDQVSRVLQRHCIECHREGQIGPFSLEQYDDVIGWADMSLEVIDQQRMPPWHANPEHGSFSNSRHMSDEDKQTLVDWVDAGMPYGDANELPPPISFVEGWQLPQSPDQIVTMSDTPFAVPADGTVEYQYFVVDPGFREDRWIRAAEVVPGNRAVVHHSIAFTRPPDGADVRDIGFLAAYVPGQRPNALPPGYAQRVRAGSKIVFQLHYTPNGKPSEDLTRIGLVFADPSEVTHEVFVLGGVEQEFEIPPGVADHAVQAEIAGFPKNGSLLSITPHMHLRGKSFRFSAQTKSGNETLLDVPAYDFNWQHNYSLSQPLPLDDVERLSFTAVFDNSADNPTNPDPSEYVTWGDQTWQEMAVTFVAVAKPRHPPENGTMSKHATSKQVSGKPQPLADRQHAWEEQASQFADQYITRFDSDGDGVLSKHELPDSVRMFGFRSFDHDRDGSIDREEIRAEKLQRLKRSR